MKFFLILATFVCELIPSPGHAGTESYIEFALPVAPPTPLELKRGIKRKADQKPEKFRGLLRIPNQANKSPAIVLTHTCHGRTYYQAWLDRLTAWGYVTLSYSRCDTVSGEPHDIANSTFDWKKGASVAFGALQYLISMEEVDPERIAIMGWSRPAMAALSVLSYEGFSQFFESQYQTAIAIYPFCSFARGPHRAPVLIVSAGRDDYVDPVVCQRNSTSSKEDRYPIIFEEIKNAYHGFDIPKFGLKHWAERAEINPDGYSANGGTLEYKAVYEQVLVNLVKQHLQQVLKP